MKNGNLSFLLLATSAALSQAQLVDYRVILTEGDIDSSTGSTFVDFEIRPGINDQGKVIFNGEVDAFGGNTSSPDGIWVWSPGGQTEALAIEGMAAVGIQGAIYRAFGEDEEENILAADGGVAFSATVTGAGINVGNQAAIYVGTPGSLSKVYQNGSPAPGRPGETFVDPNNESQNRLLLRQGQLVGFGALTSGQTSVQGGGIWQGTPGSISLIRAGDAAGPFERIQNDRWGMAPDGSITASARAGGNNGVWSFSGATSTPIIQQGSPSPGAPEGPAGIGEVLVSSSGLSFIDGIIDNPANDYFAYSWNGSALSSLVIEGGAASNIGLIEDVVTVHFNADGASVGLATLVVNGPITFDNNSVLFYSGPGSGASTWQKIFQRGDPAPGIAGASFGNTFSDTVCFNDNGIVAFWTRLQGVPSSADDSLWVWDASTGELTLIAREGATMDFGDGVARTPSFTPYLRGGGGAQVGLTSGLNNSNEIVFPITDGANGFADLIVVATYRQPGAANPIRITNFSYSSGVATMTWQSTAGSQYLIEGGTDLRGWTELRRDITSQGNHTTASVNSFGGDTAGYFRVRRQLP